MDDFDFLFISTFKWIFLKIFAGNGICKCHFEDCLRHFPYGYLYKHVQVYVNILGFNWRHGQIWL